MKYLLILVSIILAIVCGAWIFWEVVGVFTVVSWFVLALLIFGACLYAVYYFARGKVPAKAQPKRITATKVADLKRSGVYIFREEPSLKDIVLLEDELHLAQLELQGDVFQLNNDTEVIVLEDNGKEAIKVQVKGAKKKEKIDSVGWVERSKLIK